LKQYQRIESGAQNRQRRVDRRFLRVLERKAEPRIAAAFLNTAYEYMNQRAYIAVIRDDYILMVRHVHDGRDYWTLPGGRIEPGETEEGAAAREVLEETGICVHGLSRLFEADGQVCFVGTCPKDAVPKVGEDPELPAGAQWIRDVRWLRIEDKRLDLQVAKVLAHIEARG
jgi:8-oxo-dGTP diphosphatase